MSSADLKDLQDLQQSSPSLMSDETKQLIEKQVEVIAQASRVSLQKLAQTEAELDDVTNLIAGLRQQYGGGNTHYAVERKVLLERQRKLMTSANSLRTTAAQALGRWTDDSRIAFEEYAFIDPRAGVSVEGRGQTKEQEHRFRQALVKAQGSNGSSDGAFLWCPISQQYSESTLIKAAHIVDVHVGEQNAQALFGDQEEHIWSADNGILMHEAYKALLDSGCAVILPVSNAPDEKEFQFVLLEKDISRSRCQAIVWNEQLDGRRLVFQSDWRPPKKYLYFKCAISVLRRRRGEVPNYLEDLPGLPEAGKELWASPGPYLKRSILYTLARHVGCLTMEQANQFWGVDAAPMEHLSATFQSLSTGYALRLCQTMATKKTSVRSIADEEEEDEDEEDEDEDEEEDEEAIFM